MLNYGFKLFHFDSCLNLESHLNLVFILHLPIYRLNRTEEDLKKIQRL